MRSLRPHIVVTLSLAALLIACGPSPQPSQSEQSEAAPMAKPMPKKEPGVVKFAARDFSFQGPSEVPSGWVTIHFQNNGEQTHFMFLTQLPEGKTLDDYRDDVAVPFGKAWEELKSGADKAQVGQDLGAALPEWYLTSAPHMGGPGLLAPGGSETVTLKLDPGNYVVECYVRSPEGEFHGDLGMLRKLTVTAADSGRSEPTGDVDLNLTNDAIELEGALTAGTHTVAVHFVEHPPVGLGNDVHLARLAADTDMDELAQWMDWMNVDGMQAPAPVEFHGGVQEMPAGNTAYVEVSLVPGRYAWISEPVRNEGHVKEFVVE